MPGLGSQSRSKEPVFRALQYRSKHIRFQAHSCGERAHPALPCVRRPQLYSAASALVGPERTSRRARWNVSRIEAEVRQFSCRVAGRMRTNDVMAPTASHPGHIQQTPRRRRQPPAGPSQRLKGSSVRR
ncbi:hypothetical protein L227DRAFT_347653 [Lentinus tigrinus ALCF2SS1-6]|uniref:Uncharacterized protein n=1 Tax=Lentinus tigrinus ALCF2SS1-6 TaxID=1328759 RepID=A0A5C2RS30_9APHY|nr:hypothetical protein L227DRAFT_347653 [Lentinus tigrinus ALCF2SS1-6]